MKSAFVVLSLCLMMGCHEGNQPWRGGLKAHENLTIKNSEEKILISEGMELEATLTAPPNQPATLSLRGKELAVKLAIPLPAGELTYGKTVELRDFGQDFDLRVHPELQKISDPARTRYEACSEYKYHCGWQWKEGQYQHTCEHRMIHGQKKTEYQNTESLEFLEVIAVDKSGRRLAELSLSRSLGIQQTVVRDHACEPTH